MSERDLLMIPGPINFDPGVLRAMSAPTAGHTSPEFIQLFGETLDMMKQVFVAPNGIPFVIAGSGTLAMDVAVSNLVEYGDSALVLSTGYFGDRMAAIMQHYGAEVTTITAPVGDVMPLAQVEDAIKRGHPRVVAVTHVDTSTGVAADVKSVAQLAQQYDALGHRRWRLLGRRNGVAAGSLGQSISRSTASQKAIGVPPGLALLVALRASHQEIQRREKIQLPATMSDWKSWLPVMEAYLARKPATLPRPPVNLVYALHESLRQILAEGLVRSRCATQKAERCVQGRRECNRTETSTRT